MAASPVFSAAFRRVLHRAARAFSRIQEAERKTTLAITPTRDVELGDATVHAKTVAGCERALSSPHSEWRLAAAARSAGEAQISLLRQTLRPDPVYGELLEPAAMNRLAVRTVPRWHFAMLNDSERNDALAVTLERMVRPGSHVLDIGAGSGLLAMMAARAGAGHVTSCEENPLLAELATQIVAAHGMSEVITVVPKRSTDLAVGQDLPRPADVIVAEVVDCGLVGEGILPTVAHARQHLLAAGGRLVPRTGRLLGALVQSPVVARLNGVHHVSGFDLRLFNQVATLGHFPIRLLTWPHRLLSPPTELACFDFEHDDLGDGRREVTLPAAAGQAHGLVAWFELDLGAGVVLRNSPDNVGSHWMQAYIPFSRPVPTSELRPARVEVAWRDGQLSAHVLTRTPVER
jgi:type II protein arginine methyltransferase